jgi:cyclopropane-fatty-acyl-phospholipid synthase
MTDAAARAGQLRLLNLEDIGPSYALTLKHWRDRFFARIDDVRALGYDERFVRMWEFYLASSEMAFRESDMVVFQIQMAKRKGVIPQTRDYIGQEEARLRAIEAGYSAPLRLAGE